MTRRQTIRSAVLLAVGMALGKLDTLKAEGGMLTVDLGQWSKVVFTLKGKRVEVPVAEVFASLQETGAAALDRQRALDRAADPDGDDAQKRLHR